MSDQIVLRGLAVDTVIGVYEHERRAPRTVLVDLALTCDLSAASRTDALEDTVDYAALAQLVRETGKRSSFRLIERLAGEIASLCLRDARVSEAAVTIHKPGSVDRADDVSVTVTRRRSGR